MTAWTKSRCSEEQLVFSNGDGFSGSEIVGLNPDMVSGYRPDDFRGSFVGLRELHPSIEYKLMLQGFISLLLSATSSTISNICIPSKFYDESFAPCTKADIDEEKGTSKARRLFVDLLSGHSFRRMLNTVDRNTCKKDLEQSVSYQGLEQLHHFIFVMAGHISLTAA